MSVQTDYLDHAQRRAGLASDYALAVKLGLQTSYLSQLRHDRRAMTMVIAQQIGELIGEPGSLVYARIQRDRAGDAVKRRFWGEVASALQRATIAVVAGLTLAANTPLTIYIMSTGSRRPVRA